MQLCDQEVLISWTAAGSTATVYTSDPVWMRKLDRLVEENPATWKETRAERNQGGEVVSKFYECPKKLIALRAKEIKRTMTEEQKAALTDRMEKMRAAKKKGKLS